jgi:N-acetylglucosamine transport system permease protein
VSAPTAPGAEPAPEQLGDVSVADPSAPDAAADGGALDHGGDAEQAARPHRKRTPATPGDRVFGTISHIVLSVWSLLVVVPMLWTVLSSFKTTREIFKSPFSLPKHWNFDNYVSAWSTADIGQYFVNSLIVVFGGLILTMTFGSMCAYVLARFPFPGSRLIYYFLLAGLTFPIFLAVVPLFFILRQMHLLGTLPGLILVYGAFSLPFTVFFMFSFFKSLSNSIAEAAALDGAGEWRTFFAIMLPMARPGLATVAILNFVGLWNQYLLPLALNSSDPSKEVLTVGLANFNSQAGYAVNFGALFAAVVITVIPVLIVYVVFQRQLQGSVSQGTNK